MDFLGLRFAENLIEFLKYKVYSVLQTICLGYLVWWLNCDVIIS